jgi:hypothetical protein
MSSPFIFGPNGPINLNAPTAGAVQSDASGNFTAGTLPVALGGTGDSTMTAYALLAGGTTSTGALQQVSGLGTLGQILTSNGAAALPSWASAGSTAIDMRADNMTTSVVSAGQSTLVFATQTFANGISYNTSTGVATINTAGDYMVYCGLSFLEAQTPASTDNCALYIYKNASQIAESNTSPQKDGTPFMVGSVSDIINCSIGDTLSIQLNNASNTTVSAQGSANSCIFSIAGVAGGAGIPASISTAMIALTIDGGGAPPSTGVKGFVYVPYNCTINQVTMLADQSGSAVIDIWSAAYASFPPTIANTITASDLPTLSSAQKSQDSTLTGWTTSITAGAVLAFNVNSASTLTRINLFLKVTKT